MQFSENIDFCEYIKSVPPATVFEKFKPGEYSSGRRVLSGKVAREIKEALYDSLEHEIKNLTQEAAEVLFYVYLLRKIPVDSSDGGLYTEITERFLAARAESSDGRMYLCAFGDFRERIGDLLVQNIAEKGIDKPFSDDFRGNRLIITYTLFLSLLFTGRIKIKKNHEPAKSSKEFIEKFIPIFIETLDIDKESFQEIWDIFCDFGRLNGFLSFVDMEHVINKEMLYTWLDSAENSPESVKKSFLDLTGETDGCISEKLRERAGEKLIPVDVSSEEFSVNLWKMLILHKHLGLIEVVEIKGRKYWRPSVCKKGNSKAFEKPVVMPDFSVIASQNISPSDMVYIAFTCNIEQYDIVYRAKFSKDQLINTLDRAVEGRDVIGRISSWKVPENVYRSIKEWVREYFRVSVVRDWSIAVADEKTAEEIRDNQQLKGYLEEVDAHSFFRIKRGTGNHVANLLSNMGYSVNENVPEVKPENYAIDARLNLKYRKTPASVNGNNHFRSGKYGKGMKELGYGQILQVLEYSQVMEEPVEMEYLEEDGSTSVYKFFVENVVLNDNPFISGEIIHDKKNTVFYINNIKKIGML
ncbi:MAG: hypothetical protein ACOCSE_04975 [Chitinivibrionales bacterium]